MLSTPNKIISLLLAFALAINPLLGLASQMTDVPTAPTDTKSVFSIQDKFSQTGEMDNSALSSYDCCCYRDYAGICEGIDCQFCCSATIVQTVAFALFNDAYTYSLASNTGDESLEFPPAVPPPLTIRH